MSAQADKQPEAKQIWKNKEAKWYAFRGLSTQQAPLPILSHWVDIKLNSELAAELAKILKGEESSWPQEDRNFLAERLLTLRQAFHNSGH